MAKTPISKRDRRERGAALLEAAIALALVALIAGAGLTAFSRAAATGDASEARLTALAAAENALERASAPDFLSVAIANGENMLDGEGWRVTGRLEDVGRDGPLALVRLTAEAGTDVEAPLVTLETMRSFPK